MGRGLRAALGVAAMALADLALAGSALAQPPPSPPVASPGQPSLQTEPGDFWADVKAWNEQARRRVARGGRREQAAPAEVPPNPPPNTPRRPRPRPSPNPNPG